MGLWQVIQNTPSVELEHCFNSGHADDNDNDHGDKTLMVMFHVKLSIHSSDQSPSSLLLIAWVILCV